jgi:hypothetical protein
LRRGEAVTDLADAALALRTVERVNRVRAVLRPINLGAPILLAVVLLIPITLGQTDLAGPAAVILALIFAPLYLASAWISHRYRQSANATRRLQARG